MVKVNLSVAALGFAGLSRAAICNNNCGRQVAGTAVGKVSYESRQAMCSSFLATTSTVTPGVVTQTPAVVYNRNVHNRAASSPSVTGDVPAYATNCPSNVDYWSACQCFGISPTTITVTAATPTTTLTSVPTCTQGAEYALWVFDPTSAQAGNLNDAYYDFSRLNRNTVLSGDTPLQNGIVSQVGSVEQGGSNYWVPLQFDGLVAPAGTTMPYNVLEHRGYIVPAQAGNYQVRFTLVDDLAAVWIGDHAKSAITTSQSVLNGTLGSYTNSPLAYTIAVGAADVGVPIPFRVFWANSGGPAGFLWSIVDSTGTEILGYNTQKNQQVVAGCSGPGTNAPEWPAWGTEA